MSRCAGSRVNTGRSPTFGGEASLPETLVHPLVVLLVAHASSETAQEGAGDEHVVEDEEMVDLMVAFLNGPLSECSSRPISVERIDSLIAKANPPTRKYQR